MQREEARCLMCESIKKESLRGHSLAMAAITMALATQMG